jgi:hypothetical protein
MNRIYRMTPEQQVEWETGIRGGVGGNKSAARSSGPVAREREEVPPWLS